MAHEINVYMLLEWKKLNTKPFETIEDAILFAISQPHAQRMCITAHPYASITLRNGNPDRDIQPFDIESHRKPSPVTPLLRPQPGNQA